VCVCRCRKSVEFSVRTAWLIGAYAADVSKPRWKTSQGVKLRKMILHEELRSVTEYLRYLHGCCLHGFCSMFKFLPVEKVMCV